MMNKKVSGRLSFKNKAAFIILNCAFSSLNASNLDEETIKGYVQSPSSGSISLVEEKEENGEKKVLKYILEKIQSHYKCEVHPKCFISYAWDNVERNKKLLQKITKNLRTSGVEIITDEDNLAGTQLDRFINQIESEDVLVILAGSRELMRKYKTGEGLINTELTIIEKKLNNSFSSLISGRGPIIPILLEESGAHNSLPAWLRLTAYLDFSNDSQYYDSFFKLVRSIYNIPTSDKKFKKLSKDFNRMTVLLKTGEYKQVKREKAIQEEARAKEKLKKIFFQQNLETPQAHYDLGKKHQKLVEDPEDGQRISPRNFANLPLSQQEKDLITPPVENEADILVGPKDFPKPLSPSAEKDIKKPPVGK